MSYAKPPIVEAVLELQFERPLKDAESKAIRKRLSERFPVSSVVKKRQVSLDTSIGKVIDEELEEQYRQANEDENRMILVGPHSLAVSHLAPYNCWDEIRNDAQMIWDLSRKICGVRKITHYGLRYINRIDLKFNENNAIDYENYLNLRVRLPDPFFDLTAYGLSCGFNIEEIKSAVRVASGAADPVILGHGSFYIDIDITSSTDIPQKKEELFARLDIVRQHKNALFESFITDKAREMFHA